jgi:hypothetical protein
MKWLRAFLPSTIQPGTGVGLVMAFGLAGGCGGSPDDDLGATEGHTDVGSGSSASTSVTTGGSSTATSDGVSSAATSDDGSTGSEDAGDAMTGDDPTAAPECMPAGENCGGPGGPLAPQCCAGLRCKLHASVGMEICVDETCVDSGPCPADPDQCCGGFCRQDNTCGFNECAAEGEPCGGVTTCCAGLHCFGPVLDSECQPTR